MFTDLLRETLLILSVALTAAAMTAGGSLFVMTLFIPQLLG